MSWMMPAAIGGSALLGFLGNRSAGNQAAAAQREAAAIQQAQYAQTREDMAPWRDAGRTALNVLVPATATPFRTDPGYAFRYNEGLRAVLNNAAARGALGSGATMRALTRYGQGVADQQYSDWWNRNANLAGIGQTAATSGAQMGANAAAGAGQNIAAAGNAQAQGLTGGLNALLQGGAGLLGYYQQQNDPLRLAMMQRFGGVPNGGGPAAGPAGSWYGSEAIFGPGG